MDKVRRGHSCTDTFCFSATVFPGPFEGAHDLGWEDRSGAHKYPCRVTILRKLERIRAPGHLTTVRLGARKNSLTAIQASEKKEEKVEGAKGRRGSQGRGKQASCSLPLGPGSPLNPGAPG